LREEIARLKGLKGRPKLKPSGMEKAADAARSAGRKHRRGAKRTALAIDETRILKLDSLPEGARFKGYEDFIVQDIVIKPWTVRYRRDDAARDHRRNEIALPRSLAIDQFLEADPAHGDAHGLHMPVRQRADAFEATIRRRKLPALEHQPDSLSLFQTCTPGPCGAMRKVSRTAIRMASCRLSAPGSS
jgi:hypothetical protein